MPSADCPKCGMHNCASELNYCMYGCGHAFNDIMGIYTQIIEEPKKEEIKIIPGGQLNLFGTQYLRAN